MKSLCYTSVLDLTSGHATKYIHTAAIPTVHPEKSGLYTHAHHIQTSLGIGHTIHVHITYKPA